MSRWLSAVVAAVGFCVLAACNGDEEGMTAPVGMPTVREVSSDEWGRLRSRRIFFGHQSVGADILAGVEEILKQRPEIALRVVETADPTQMKLPGLYHARVGRNGAPLTKLEDFVGIASAGVGDSGTALLKYCYIDITGDTDPDALFEAYQRSVDSLRVANPGLTILHLTLPLQTDWGEYFHWKRVIRGKLTTHRELNAIRHAYNMRLRQAYAGREPIFDVAHWQSITPDGTVHSVRFRGARVPILARRWTSDGGHLNPEGRRWVGEAFLVALARL